MMTTMAAIRSVGGPPRNFAIQVADGADEVTAADDDVDKQLESNEVDAVDEDD